MASATVRESIAICLVAACSSLALVVASSLPLTARVTGSGGPSWIYPAKSGDPLLWGRTDGVIFGLPSMGGLPGPRGLIRVGLISPTTGLPELLNYIAIEPVVVGKHTRGDRMAFSELEPSQLDPGFQGKRLWVGENSFGQPQESFSSLAAGGEEIGRLTVRIEVERFQANGAHVYILASMDSDHPQELRLSVFAYEDSPKIEELTLTATMGNYERLRWLWLKNRLVDSRALYHSYHGEDFAERGTYPLKKMLHTSNGDAIVFCTTNEAHPSTNPDFRAVDHWRYKLRRLTQYWRVPAAEIQADLRVRVNGREVYWASHSPLAGGIAFENFEVRQRYSPGQSFIFGAVAEDPWEIKPAIRLLPKPRAPEAN